MMLEVLLMLERAEEPPGAFLMLERLERAEEPLGMFLELEMLLMLEVLMRAEELLETGVRIGPIKTLPMRDFKPGMEDELLVLVLDGRRLPLPDAMLVGSDERVMVRLIQVVSE